MASLTVRKSSLVSSQQEIKFNECQSTYSVQGLTIIVTVRFSCYLELIFAHSSLNANTMLNFEMKF